MSIHKLTAGSGYDYLTRQVAAQDVTERGHAGLSSYYAEKGESPGQWVGSGLAGIDGLNAGDEVTAEQMKYLYGSGRHPLAGQLQDRLEGPDLTAKDYDAVTRLGAPFKVYAGDVSAFRVEVAKRMAAVNHAQGLPGDWPLSVADRARVRTDVAVEFFRAEHGRDPDGPREVAATIAKHSRPRTTAVAGFDLTFRPVKSVSTLWAIADPATAAVIEQAHTAAVGDALAFIEQHALFTRTGTNGVRQVEVRGLIGASFTHRDSRAGDPLLHTHVAVANKVQTLDGRWLSIDGRVLFKATVAASETYNTALERHLTDALGVRFEERPNPDPRKCPVREVVGVDPRLNQRWSTRRADIEVRRRELAQGFLRDHGRPPTPIESIRLAQQATLETRAPKHEPRSLTEQRTAWAAQARDVLGGDRHVHAMLTHVLNPTPAKATRVDTAWMTDTAAQILDALQARRSHWQTWHVRGEAHRHVRAADVPTRHVEQVVDLLIDEVLTRHSVPLTRSGDGIPEPGLLRRRDGASVYTVAGSDLFTSARILAAEARIVARAGQYDGPAVTLPAVEVALLESAANGLALNAGQAALVRQMATSGARVQLAIAPAGAGKTTAMSALAAAWVEGGGTVIGLAPSAAAAAVLRDQLRAGTDTLAKLTWALAHHQEPDWADQVGPRTLVVIDEAGMADTLTLDATIEYALARGAAVRLIGDDQQLAAIGAGGVLRDIDATHGSVHLSELMRFTDPAEGAASLALREGLPEALGFYLDTGRVHVGDLATITDDVFTAWRADHASGRDAVMLAPTRDLVADLNRRARDHHHGGTPTGPTQPLADGNHASVGDLVITRTNDRRLRTTATDWVKNGDRWRVTALHPHGALTVRHARTGRVVTLPPDYVTASVELGYACTIHTAQGLTADTSHTLLTGTESRQQTYTAATRGAHANHLYLQVVGDGDPHTLIRPETIHPATATDLLEQILARDDSPRSATTMRRDADDPATRLGHATARYLDALTVAAEHHLGPAQVAALDTHADRVVPDLTTAPAWPTLRARLVLLAAHHIDPLHRLYAAATARELDTAGDAAAVLDWRLDDTLPHPSGPGPLPWVPAIPPALTEDPQWGPYLAARAAHVRALADQVRADAPNSAAPAWVRHGHARPDPGLLADIAVWRAATQVDPTDRRPTGPPQLAAAPAAWQNSLRARVADHHNPAVAEWGALLDRVAPATGRDPYRPDLADRLAAISRAGLDARTTLRRALTEGPLPDDHGAAALWWRIARHLTPAVANHADTGHHLATAWTPRLPDLLGADHTAQLQASTWWPALVTAVDHALARGCPLEDLLTLPHHRDDGFVDVDACQALVWRITVLTDPPPPLDETGPWPDTEQAPDDAWTFAAEPAAGGHTSDAPTPEQWRTLHPVTRVDPPDNDTPVADLEVDPVTPQEDDMSTDAYLHLAALARPYAGPLDPTDRQVLNANDRAYRADTARVSPERIRELNTLAQDYFTSAYPTSWAPAYLRDRFGVDPAQTRHAHPGYAPAGWTALVTHLRRHGATDTEILDAGLATTTRTGRVIDRFRDRVTFPIVHTGHILGFVARRNPALDQAGDGPKYLNTADTILFHKGAQLYGVDPHLLAAGARPVLVEGPLDALAVTLTGRDRYLGVAPLGTTLTEDQAAQLATLNASPLVATDADPAGRVAAHRAYWLLTQHGLTPHAVTLPDGADPAALLAREGPAALREALDQPRTLSEVVLDEHLAGRTGLQALRGAAAVAAAADPQTWDHTVDRIADNLAIPTDRVRRELAAAVCAWDSDPRPVVAHHLATLTSARTRLATRPADPPPPRRRDMQLATPKGRPHTPELAPLGSRVDQAPPTHSPRH